MLLLEVASLFLKIAALSSSFLFVGFSYDKFQETEVFLHTETGDVDTLLFVYTVLVLKSTKNRQVS